MDPRSYGSLLCPVLTAKLPAEMQLTISRKVSEADWNPSSLMEAIEEEIQARERISVEKPDRQMPRREDKMPHTATTLMSGNTSNSQIPCCYCNQSHPPTKCSIITSVEDRKQSLRKSGRCFLCLRRGHLSHECRSQGRCHSCNGHNHTSICNKKNADEPHTPQT